MSRSLVLSNSELIEKSVANNEGELTHTGALLSLTGNRTGRSTNDRFIVKESSTEDNIEWGEVNKPCLLYTSPSPRDGLLSRMPSSA